MCQKVKEICQKKCQVNSGKFFKEIYFKEICILFVIAVSAVPVPNFRKTNLMSLSKASVENNRNQVTNFFAATIENENETGSVQRKSLEVTWHF